jgi:hypothetical protein
MPMTKEHVQRFAILLLMLKRLFYHLDINKTGYFGIPKCVCKICAKMGPVYLPLPDPLKACYGSEFHLKKQLCWLKTAHVKRNTDDITTLACIQNKFFDER